mmetsp:Transcript_102072/g.284984  ORF Transcript_102072/g.284984 Transcript_102072/m.284984 type:complete len:357 (+) Transcript_102072:433-1503(+)
MAPPGDRAAAVHRTRGVGLGGRELRAVVVVGLFGRRRLLLLRFLGLDRGEVVGRVDHRSVGRGGVLPGGTSPEEAEVDAVGGGPSQAAPRGVGGIHGSLDATRRDSDCRARPVLRQLQGPSGHGPDDVRPHLDQVPQRRPVAEGVLSLECRERAQDGHVRLLVQMRGPLSSALPLTPLSPFSAQARHSGADAVQRVQGRNINFQLLDDILPGLEQIRQASENAVFVVAKVPRRAVRQFHPVRHGVSLCKVYPRDANVAIGVCDEEYARADKLVVLHERRLHTCLVQLLQLPQHLLRDVHRDLVVVRVAVSVVRRGDLRELGEDGADVLVGEHRRDNLIHLLARLLAISGDAVNSEA